MNGTKADIDRVMEFLNPTAHIPITRVVDYYLGTVKTAEGVEQKRRRNKNYEESEKTWRLFPMLQCG